MRFLSVAENKDFFLFVFNKMQPDADQQSPLNVVATKCTEIKEKRSRMGDCRTSLHHTCLLHAQPSARHNQLAETHLHTGCRDVGRRAPGEKSRVETCNLISCSFYAPSNLHRPVYQSLHSTKSLINTSPPPSPCTHWRFYGNRETKQVLQGQSAPGAQPD